jgi:hypothetical protein
MKLSEYHGPIVVDGKHAYSDWTLNRGGRFHGMSVRFGVATLRPLPSGKWKMFVGQYAPDDKFIERTVTITTPEGEELTP